MTINYNNNKQYIPEKIFTSTSVGEIFGIIGDTEFLRMILKDETEQLILYKRWKENKTLDAIAKEMGLPDRSIEHLYPQIVRKTKAKIKRFIKSYITTQSKDVKRSIAIDAIANNLKKNEEKKDSKSITDIPISDLISKKPRWVDILKCNGVNTLGQLQKYTRNEVKLFSSIGHTTMQEIDFVMNYYKLNYKV